MILNRGNFRPGSLRTPSRSYPRPSRISHRHNKGKKKNPNKKIKKKKNYLYIKKVFRIRVCVHYYNRGKYNSIIYFRSVSPINTRILKLIQK